ncbi:MAG: DUF86 domain-containing protein [Schwartzia sp.]|nr:DUF86 domain-containing protein [Schwartzia sp. (in: firmicutes)]
MKRGDKDYQRLIHLIKYCEKLKAVGRSMNGEYDAFVAKENYEKIDVSSFYIGQIGELTHGLTDTFKNEHPDIPWKQIVDMRNTLVHRYGTRNTKIIWDVIVKDIPLLAEQCQAILTQANPDIANEIKAELREETNILP